MSLQLEAFESSIKGRRIRWILSPDAPISYPPGFQEQIFTESPGFQRKILISSHQSSEAWKLVDNWDTMFVPQTAIDWSILIAYLQNISSSICIVTPETQIPNAFYQKLVQLGPKIPTLVVFTNQIMAPFLPFDATFFPPARDIEICIDQTNSILQSLLTPDILRAFVIKDAIRDLRSAGATIVVSSIEESKSSLYWYYTSESGHKEKRLIETVLQTLLKRF